MGRNILQQIISQDQARKLCIEGKTGDFKGFVSKKGRRFSAKLKLEGDKVTFEFEPRPATKEPKKAAAPKKSGAKAKPPKE
jgi:DNA topoisomerase-3